MTLNGIMAIIVHFFTEFGWFGCNGYSVSVNNSVVTVNRINRPVSFHSSISRFYVVKVVVC